MNPINHAEERKKALTRIEGYICNRPATHGGEDSFNQIAEGFTWWLKNRGLLVKNGSLTREDVCALMVLMKLGRAAGKTNFVDHWDDIAGYAVIGSTFADQNTQLQEQEEPKEVAPWTTHQQKSSAQALGRLFSPETARPSS